MSSECRSWICLGLNVWFLPGFASIFGKICHSFLTFSLGIPRDSPCLALDIEKVLNPSKTHPGPAILPLLRAFLKDLVASKNVQN